MADEKVKEKKEKKRKEPGKVRRWFKDFFSELKKVTWPSFTKVLKQTGIVLLVTICFMLVMMLFDTAFGYVWRGLIGELGSLNSVVMNTVARGGGWL